MSIQMEEIMKNKTVELVLPQWQGGNNPDYVIGNHVLSSIIPQKNKIDKIEIPVSTEQISDDGSGIAGEDVLFQQFQATTDVLNIQKPARVITIGGDCSVSESPFDYLNGKYDDLGVIWLDVHPDVSNPSNSHHLHEMVLANLLNVGAPRFNNQVKNHIKPDHVMLAGLKYDELRLMDQTVNDLSIPYATPEDLSENFEGILTWIKDKNIKHLAIHWDLDVLSPDDFRSIYPAEPHTNVADFPAAVGSMKLKQIFDLLTTVGNLSDIVGLTIAEHMPWDAINLRRGLEKLTIFN